MNENAVCRGVLSGLAALALSAATASAEIPLLDKGGLKLGGTISGAVGFVNTNDTNFGAGAGNIYEGTDGDTNVDWYEGYLKAGLNASYAIPGGAGSLYGSWVMVGTATWDGQDAYGYSEGSPEDISQDQLYAGWRSGASGDDSLLDLSFGQQCFTVGDGFLLSDGDLSNEHEGAYWLGPKTAFTRAAVARINTTPVRGDWFWLKGDPDQGDTALWGVNLEFPTEKFGTFGAMYLKLTDSDWESRDRLDVWDFRWSGTFADRLFLSAEYVRELNDDPANDVDATAWYGEAGYTLAGLPWTPSLTYRYSFMSGDGNAESGDNTSFDPLFYGVGRGWGTWLQGEIVGEYLLFNSNQKTHMLALRAKPTESLGIGLLLFRFDLDRRPGGSTGQHFADEANLYADWQVNDYLYLGAVAGIAKPYSGAESLLGDEADDTYKLFEVMASVSF